MDTSIFTVRNKIVYSRPIDVYQGIDNPIQFIVNNQDQKKVNVTGYTVQVDIQGHVNNVVVWSANVDFNANLGGNIQQGQGYITVPKDLLANLEQRIYKLTTRTISNTGAERPLYVDDDYGVPIDIRVLPG